MISLVKISTKPRCTTNYLRGSGTIRFTAIDLMDKDGNTTYNFSPGATIGFECSYPELWRSKRWKTA